MEEFTLPSGEVAQVRSLTGFEFMLGRKRFGDDELSRTALYLGFMLGGTDVDSAVRLGIEWMKTHSVGDLNAINQRINELSGLVEGATKSNVDRDGGGRDH